MGKTCLATIEIYVREETLKIILTTSETTYVLVWEMVRKIPKGKVASYGQIATLCGLSGHARFVGYALHNLPPGVPVPWQRVINSQGKISFPPNSNNFKRQKELLESEGILIYKGKIDLKKYGWKRS